MTVPVGTLKATAEPLTSPRRSGRLPPWNTSSLIPAWSSKAEETTSPIWRARLWSWGFFPLLASHPPAVSPPTIPSALSGPPALDSTDQAYGRCSRPRPGPRCTGRDQPGPGPPSAIYSAVSPLSRRVIDPLGSPITARRGGSILVEVEVSPRLANKADNQYHKDGTT